MEQSGIARRHDDRIRKISGDLTDDQVEEFYTKISKHIEAHGVDAKVVELLNKLNCQPGRTELVNRLQNFVFERDNMEDICNFAFVHYSGLEKAADIIIKTRDGKLICKLANAIASQNIGNKKYEKELTEKLQTALFELDDIAHLCAFATCMKFADKRKIQKLVVETKNVKLIKLFADQVEGVNKKKLYKICDRLLAEEVSPKTTNSNI